MFHLSVGFLLLKDFHGGEFIFEATPNKKDIEVMAVEPKAGRVVLFSSDAENPHKAPSHRGGVKSHPPDTNFNENGMQMIKCQHLVGSSSFAGVNVGKYTRTLSLGVFLKGSVPGGPQTTSYKCG